MNQQQDMTLRKVLDITCEKLQDMSPFEKSTFLKCLDTTLCRGVKDCNITDDTYISIDKLCIKLVLMKYQEQLLDEDVNTFEHILIEGIDFNRLTKETLCLIASLFYTDNIYSKLEETEKFICGKCGKDIVICGNPGGICYKNDTEDDTEDFPCTCRYCGAEDIGDCFDTCFDDGIETSPEYNSV